MTDRIRHERHYDTGADRVFSVLTEAEQFSRMSGGAPADIDASEGGAFSCFGGMIVGRNIECVPGERLVQAWRATNWAPGAYSIVSFSLSPEAGGTRLVLEQSGFPEGQAEHLEAGWIANYLDPLGELVSRDDA